MLSVLFNRYLLSIFSKEIRELEPPVTYCNSGNRFVKTTDLDIADVTPNQLRCN